MSTNLQYHSIDKNSWMNKLTIPFLLFFFCSVTVFAADYEEGKQAYLSKNYALALEILKPLAEAGDSQAQITMGLMYDYGHGVDKSPAESIKWYRMAAEQGVPLVQHDIGVKYFQGQGVEQNYLEAAKWWELSANSGIADSQFNLGLMHYRGIGIPKDYVKAAKLFEAAAEQGHGNAQYSLAVMYAFGKSKTKDYAAALKWFNKSAEQDVAQAQFNLGVFHENGYGVEKNIIKAREWYQLAADQGLQEAKQKLQALGNSKTTVATKSKSVESSRKAEPTHESTRSATTAVETPTTSGGDLNLSNWLKQQAADSYTLQLGSVINENDIVNYIKKSGLGSKAGFIVVSVNGTTRYTAIYGLYESYKNAEIAVSELPMAIQRTKPWVRNTGILQGLLQQ